MKKLLIVLLLIPCLAFAWGTKPKTVNTVTGTVTASVDSSKQRKSISIDNIGYVIEDSLGVTSITGNDSSSVTSTALGNVQGYIRVGVMANDAIDSVAIYWNFGGRTVQKFLYADTAQVKGSETAYLKADNMELTADKIYWCILYDDTDTSPINCIPTANRTITVEVVQRGTDTSTGYTIFIQRQVN